jgi:FtsP/CotA-like multicopper oxidase with cupredoxin domain
MNRRSRCIRQLAIVCAAIFPWQPARAQTPTATSASARVAGDHWQLSVRPANGGYTLTIDGKIVPRAAGDNYSLPRLPRGLHTVEIGAVPPLRLLIQESGARSHDAAARTEVFHISLGKTVLGRPGPTFRVKQGDLVRLDWASAAPAEVHLHGYDIEGNVGPASPLSMIFEANLAGRFPAETHGKVHSAAAFLEVYPR